VIAIVTDQLTDNAIIFDLHTAASRGVPVYIILNQRSLQGNFTLNRLRHPVSQHQTHGHCYLICERHDSTKAASHTSHKLPVCLVT
ncbi:hypothetical protein GOODEAATRI_032950, partial [Goodea atripinnis]